LCVHYKKTSTFEIVETMEKLSVIIPCYNVENYIEETIVSLINQTYKGFTIYCLDDCSSDKTFDKLLELQLKYPQIKLFRNEINLGVIETLNKLITLCESEFIIRMDSDDIFEYDRVEKLLQEAEKGKLHIVSSSYSFIDFRGKEIVNKRGLYLCTLNKAIKFMALLNSPFPSQALFSKQIFDREIFDTEFKVAEDYYFFTKVLKNNDIKVANLSEKLYKYRINPNGLSNSNELLMRQNHYNIAVRYAKNILDVSADDMEFLKIGLKLLDYNKYSGREIAKILKNLFKIKNLFLAKYLPSLQERNEIETYTKQYYLYLLYCFVCLPINPFKKVVGLSSNIFTLFFALNLENIKWLIKNK